MPSTPRSRPPSPCRWSSRISTGRAATCRSSSRREARQDRSDLRAGAGAGRRDHRALPRDSASIWCPGTGLLAACVPGMFDTWMLLLRDYGTMRLADVLTPAIAYARNGYPLVERTSATIDMVEDLFREHWPTSAAVYLPDGKVPAPGTMFSNPTHGRHLCAHPARGRKRRRRPRSADRARAQDLVARLRRRGDRQILPHAGGDGYLRPSAIAACSPAQDMARWQATVEPPITLRLRPLHGLQARALEPGPGDAADSWRCSRASISTRIDPTEARNSSICRSSAPSSLSPTATHSTATRISSKVPIDDAAVRCLQRRAPQD